MTRSSGSSRSASPSSRSWRRRRPANLLVPSAAGTPASLLESARALLARSVAPYSRFRVAALLEDANSSVHPGVNVESASYGLLIRVKRDGGALSRDQIGRWIRGVADGSIPDYESAALLMAITLRGMDREETVALTDALLHSGRVLGWNGIGRPTVDKHSTGGVGDKISIALAPWVAAR